MRTLIYVPIIHTSADLGSLAGDVTKRSIADLGEDVWREHQRTVKSFWDVITDYFTSVDKAMEIGINWWQHDSFLSPGSKTDKNIQNEESTIP